MKSNYCGIENMHLTMYYTLYFKVNKLEECKEEEEMDERRMSADKEAGKIINITFKILQTMLRNM